MCAFQYSQQRLTRRGCSIYYNSTIESKKMATKIKKKNLMVGKWIPTDREALLDWARKELEVLKRDKKDKYDAMRKYFPKAHSEDEELREFVKTAANIEEFKEDLDFHDSINNLIYAMGTEQDVGMLIVQMFYQQDSPKAITTVEAIFFLDYLITWSPRFVSEDSGITIPCPIGCFLTYAMATPAGFAAFVKTRVNDLFRDILNEYAIYLTTPDSAEILDDVPGGWFTEKALEEMPDFNETFDCHPGEPHRGFTSFDAFFTRTLKQDPTLRPISHPNDDTIVVNACENAPYQVSYCVGRYDAFWAKSQPYSLQYILDNDPLVERFDGGTIYQGFLSPHTYHRFHAPISGEILTKKVVKGTYFSQPYYKDESANYIASQPYLAHMAARGIIIIRNNKIGHVAFIPIGMVDVSTVDLKLLDGKTTVTKGENIGTFHFGGSSHLLIFERGIQLAFDLQGIKPDPLGNDFVKVNSKIATIVTTAPDS